MASKRTYRGIDQLTGRDKIVVALMVVVPTLMVLWLVWLPAIGSVLLSFTNWDGIGPLSGIKSVGLQNYKDIVTIYPPFWPAIQHNLIWLAVLFFIATPLGMLFAVLVDRGVAGHEVLPDEHLPAGRALTRPHRLHLAADLLA